MSERDPALRELKEIRHALEAKPADTYSRQILKELQTTNHYLRLAGFAAVGAGAALLFLFY